MKNINLEIKAEEDAVPFMDLLLLADPSPAMIMDYLADGTLFSARWDGVVVGVFVLMHIDDVKWELKNIAVAPEWQKKGVGKALLQAAIEEARREGAKLLDVGTGNSSIDQLAFYQKMGFRMRRIAKNYYTLNYPEPIYENGIQCRDMVVLTLELTEGGDG
ncbi:GNAT family N-acetyltransferase [Kordiimonas lacus]|uniref:Ribosomal protein S18 acetylase RimI n=1 Tax=Kordiimonas lacus TaxID=637679 RepID=A0A1G6YSD8_9PROT|nr:GNAT family N-acetyltransferase [Kordiimonas lacus]SDD93192.1 Ribosomal protein S18 acetylase RimI [Kordiimonas lacus]